MHILETIEKHPLITGLTVFALGYGVLAVLGVIGGGGGNSGAASYFAAQSAQAQAGDALQIAQIQAQAAITQTQLNDTAAQNIQTTWATAATTQGAQQVQETQAVAPYYGLAAISSAISNVASIPPLTSQTTSSKKSSGFFGIGGGTSQSVTTTQTANPNAVNAMAELEALLGNRSSIAGLNAGS